MGLRWEGEMRMYAFRVLRSAFRVLRSGFRVPCSAFRVLRSGFRVPRSAFCVPCSVFRVPGLELKSIIYGMSDTSFEVKSRCRISLLK